MLSASSLTAQYLSAQREMAYSPRRDEMLPDWVTAMYAPDADPGLVTRLYEAYYREQPFEKNQHTQYYKRWLAGFARQVTPDRERDAAYLRAYAAQQQSRMPASWTTLGPIDWDHAAASRSYAPGSAHVYTVEQSVSNPDVLYAGTANAGVWKSVDHGITWSPQTSGLLTGSVTALEIDPTNANIVYAELLGNIRKTTNGGNTWSPTGDAAFQALNFSTRDIRCKPDQPATVYAATSNGLYKSTNSGTTWSSVLAGNVLEVEFHPTRPDTVYAVRRNGDKTEFYRSLNNGSSFTLQSAGWPNPNTGAGEHQRRTELSVSPDAPDNVYALATGSANGGSGLYGVYVSANAGVNWSFQCCGPQPAGPPSAANPNLMGWSDQGLDDGGQYYYDLAFGVSPYNADSIWVCGVNLWVSGNGGTSFTCPAAWSHSYKPNYVHADIHDLHYFAHTGEIWVANDGGIFYSGDRGANFHRRNVGITGSDFWGFGMGHWFGNVMLGGAYHNGTLLKEEDTYINGWICTDGGDGVRGFVNPGLDRQAYSDYNIKRLKSNRTLAPETRPFTHKPNASYITGESSDLLFHPNYYGTWYSGDSSKLWLTRDDGYTFTLIHDFGYGNKIVAADISASDPNVIYVCTFPGWWDTKRIYRTTNGGSTWTEITPSLSVLNNQDAWIPYDIAIDPHDPMRIWIVRTSMYGDSPNYDGYKVFTSADGGNTWTNITGTNLNGQFPTCLMHQRGTDGGIYVGTRNTVYYRNAVLPDWEMYGAGLPARTNAVKLLPWYRHGKLRNATNRSVWETPFYEPSQPIATPAVQKQYLLCERDTAHFVDLSVLHETGVSWSWSFPGGTPSTSTLRNPKVTYHQPGIFDVTLVVHDTYGTDTAVIEGMVIVDRRCGVDTTAGGAFSTSGNPGHVRVLDVDQNVTSFTVTAWVKPDGIQSDYAGIVMNDGNAAGINFREGNNTLGYHWPGGSWSWDSNLILPPGQWSYVSMTVQPGSVTLSVNGVFATHNTNVQPVMLTDLRIGSYQGWGDRNVKGQIDEVCLWTRALTQDEIRLSRHLVKDPFGDPDILAYYQFDILDGAEVLDKTGVYDAMLNSPAVFAESDAPVGAGTSQMLQVNAPGYASFTSGGDAGIGFNATHPNGKVVATHLHVLPNQLPASGTIQGNYWIVNNYGSTQSFPALDSLILLDAGSASSAMAGAFSFDLYTRAANATGAWSVLAPGTTLVTPGVSATIHVLSIPSPGSLGQYIVMRDTVPHGLADVEVRSPAIPEGPVSGGSSVALAVRSTDQGIRLPLVTTAQLQSTGSPSPGMVAFLTDSLRLVFYTGIRWAMAGKTAVLRFPASVEQDTVGLVAWADTLPMPSALVRLQAGFLQLPVFGTAGLPQIDYPATGMLVFDLDARRLRTFDGQAWTGLASQAMGLPMNQDPSPYFPGVAVNQSSKHPSAALEISGAGGKAFSLPHAEPGAIYDPVPGLITFSPSTGAIMLFDGLSWNILR